MTEIDRSPTRLASTLATISAVIAVGVPGLYSWSMLGLGAVGLAIFVIGVVTGNQGAVTVGATGIFLGVIFAGFDGAPELVLLIGAVATILAWDSATTAIDVGRQLGNEASTARVELVHVSATALVGGAAVGGSFGVYRLAAGEGTVTAVFLCVLAAVFIAAALR